MGADGTGQRQLTDSSYDASHPAVSPDGRYLLFTSDRAGPGNIWRIDINGTNPKRLTDGGNDLMPYGSPDGKWVIYSSNRNLSKAPIDGGASVQLTNVPMARGGIVSPDGKLITCWYLPNTQYDLKIASSLLRAANRSRHSTCSRPLLALTIIFVGPATVARCFT